MNWQEGFHRLSAVTWTGCALAGVAWVAYSFYTEAYDYALVAMFAVAAALLMHRVTCWVINGFFAPRT